MDKRSSGGFASFCFIRRRSHRLHQRLSATSFRIRSFNRLLHREEFRNPSDYGIIRRLMALKSSEISTNILPRNGRKPDITPPFLHPVSFNPPLLNRCSIKRASSRRRKSRGLRFRGFRRSRESLQALDCSSSSNRSSRFDLILYKRFTYDAVRVKLNTFYLRIKGLEM